MTAPGRIAVLGDIHGFWTDFDVAWFNGSGYDLVLVVGDLAGPGHRGCLAVARKIAALRVPALVLPGNHDAVSVPQLVGEITGVRVLSDALAGLQARRCGDLERTLAPVPLCGYSRHDFDLRGGGLSVVAARPHSMGGPALAFRAHLQARFGIDGLEGSAARLIELVDACPNERILFLAHNGPTGLGGKRTDPFGCDFKSAEGDWGDADLRQAVDHARSRGRHVVAVVAGHMHIGLKGGGERSWSARQDEVLHVNAARVPRIAKRGAEQHHHHVLLEIDGERARAEEVWVPA